jgi:hypothetical protein
LRPKPIAVVVVSFGHQRPASGARPGKPIELIVYALPAFASKTIASDGSRCALWLCAGGCRLRLGDHALRLGDRRCKIAKR